MSKDKNEKVEKVEFTQEELALIEEKRNEQKLIAEAAKKINDILEESGLDIVINPASPIGNPSVIIVKRK